MKKLTVMLLVFCLAFLSVPPIAAPVSAADSDYFVFPGEQDTFDAARVVLTSSVDLTGTLNNVIGSTVTYSVEKVIKVGGVEQTVPGMARLNQTVNNPPNGNTIRIVGIQLYPGVNKITFKGQQGFTEVTNTIYIEYRDSPTLHDLKAIIGDARPFDILEDKTTVIYSNTSRNQDDYDISITGKAPNADRVTVIVNGRSYTYTVSATNGYSFAASPVNVVQGKNILTIRVHNGTQYVETTRDIAFYNGKVTFYDLRLSDGTNSVPLDNSPNFTVDPSAAISVTGKAIVPLKWGTTPFDRNGDGDTTDPGDFNLDPPLSAAGMQLAVALDGTWRPAVVPTNEVPDYDDLTPANNFVTVEFTESLGTATALTFTNSHSLTFRGLNVTRTAPDNMDQSGSYSFHLRDADAPYIQELNYLPGFSTGLNLDRLSALTGSPMNGAVIPALPLGVELLIGNVSGSTVPDVELSGVSNSSGTPYTDGFAFIQLNTGNDTSIVTKNVDGVDQQFQRVFLQIDQLPVSGTLNLEFEVDGVKKTARINLLYGPFAQFDNLYDNMAVNFDTTSTTGLDTLIDGTFDFFRGRLLNVSNPATIFYANNTDTGDLQTVFFYINNIEVKLKVDPTDSNSDKRKFVLDEDPGNLTRAYDAIYKGGENIVKFVYRTKTNNYVKETKFNIVPTNLPVIPAPDTLGVFPYSTNRDPSPNDPNFELRGNVYVTTEAKMNVYGTFDFVDLGKSQTAVNGKLGQSGFAPGNYILQIQTAGEPVREWTLMDEFQATSRSMSVTDTFNAARPSQIRVTYDYDNETFAFVLSGEALPPDGSSKVYTITVFNSGKTGPRAQYRLEVDPTNIPYTVLAPVEEKRTINQSFVDVILFSEGAQRVEIDGEVAKKVVYNDYSQSGDPLNAFMVTVTGLKANKPTEIDILIANGDDEIKDSITVTYTPENIPGAKVMEKMKNNHKVFSGALELKFPGGTNLIRRDYNSTDPFKSQVYSGNELLFAIANPTDGVVDRHEFESVPAGYDLNVELGSVYFSATFPSRFVKSSPVFWIDGGQADDASSSSPAYDPITRGYDPLPLKLIEGDDQAFFYNRDPDREIVPSKRGELKLSYDSSVRQSAGVTVTVFRFDPYIKQWENIGGKVDEKKNTITVPFDRFGYYVVGKLSYGYNDITDHRYAREAIEAVFTKGVMNPVDPSGAFGTDDYVTRAEFARMIVRALDLQLNYIGPKHFLDVGDTGDAVSLDAIWDYRYVETAARAGFIKGTQPRVFEPTNHITREDASVMLAKALNLKLDTNLTNIRKTLQKSFKDEASINDYAKPSVAAILKKDLIAGSPVDSNDLTKGYVFEPKSRLLRAEAAIIIARVMKDQKRLPDIFAPR